MPRRSIKQQILDFKVERALSEIDFIKDIRNGTERENEIDEVLDNLMDDAIAVYSCRRGDQQLNPSKSIQSRCNVLNKFNDEQFLEMMRVSRSQFAHLVSLIQSDKVFNNYNLKMLPIELQLGIVLYRLGATGENATVRSLAATFEVGVGSIPKITDRIFTAILRKMPKYLKWPNKYERKFIVKCNIDELPNCIGYIGCRCIKLSEKPKKYPELYYSSQGNYCIKLQIVCDHKLRILHAVVCNSGSYEDEKIFNNCQIVKSYKEHFDGNQWIAGNSAYPSYPFLITPNCNITQEMEAAKCQKFKNKHERCLVQMENCFEILMKKFASLKDLRLRLGDSKSQTISSNWLMVCCILHNIFLEYQDLHITESDESDDSGG